MNWAEIQVEADAPVDLDTLLEQLDLAAREAIGTRATVELVAPLRPNSGWRAYAREFGVAHIEASGRTPTDAAKCLARELLAQRPTGRVEADALGRLLRGEP